MKQAIFAFAAVIWSLMGANAALAQGAKLETV